MKPIHMDFVPDRRWIAIWIVTGLICLAVGGASIWKWQQSRQAVQRAEARIAALRQEIALSAKPAPVINLREENTRQATRLLHQDLNAAFAAVENLNEPNVRLKSFNLDNVAAVLRVEYEIDSISRAASVTAVLNAGYENRPWLLESASTPQQTGSSSAPQQTMMGRGVWSAQLDKL